MITFIIANFGFFAQIALGLIPILKKIMEKMDNAELQRAIEKQQLGTDLAYIAMRVEQARAAAEKIRTMTDAERDQHAYDRGWVRKDDPK